MRSHSYERIILLLLLAEQWSKGKDPKLWSNFFQQQHLDLWHISRPVVCCCFGIASRSATWLCFWWPGQATLHPSCSLTHSGALTLLHHIGKRVLHERHESHSAVKVLCRNKQEGRCLPFLVLKKIWQKKTNSHQWPHPWIVASLPSLNLWCNKNHI